jgi:hypothetical protein
MAVDVYSASLMAYRFTPLLLLALLMGCSSPGGTITLDSYERNRTFTQSFGQAYISHALTGESDLVLIESDDVPRGSSSKKGEPLQPTPISPLRQVMRVHLYWQPLAGTTKNPAAINASIDWYVLGADGPNDLLVYEGAGFVTVEDHGARQYIRIRDGQVKPRLSRGQMQDPVGSARIWGVATARVDDARVKDSITQMEQQARPVQAIGSGRE